MKDIFTGPPLGRKLWIAVFVLKQGGTTIDRVRTPSHDNGLDQTFSRQEAMRAARAHFKREGPGKIVELYLKDEKEL